MKLKTILLSLVFLISHSAFADNHLDFSLSDYCDESPEAKAQFKDGLYYHPEQEKPYTGESICFYKNGQPYYWGKLKGGLFHGKSTMWYENGQKNEEGNYKDGNYDGKYTWWYENAQIKAEAYYIGGARAG